MNRKFMGYLMLFVAFTQIIQLLGFMFWGHYPTSFTIGWLMLLSTVLFLEWSAREFKAGKST